VFPIPGRFSVLLQICFVTILHFTFQNYDAVTILKFTQYNRWNDDSWCENFKLLSTSAQEIAFTINNSAADKTNP